MGFYICRGTGRYYRARVHRRSARKYELLGKPTKTFGTALRRLTEAWIADRNGLYNRGDVILCEDYYEPIVLTEITKP
jgi:hypothetical protein